MAKKTFKPGTMLNPVPVVMVSCGDSQERNIITIAWTGILNSEPPMTYVAVRKSRHSHDIIKRNGEYVINLVNQQLTAACDFCGVRSGEKLDKWKETGLTPVPAEKVSCPMIKESPVNLECKVKDILEYPSHDVFVAEIVNVHADEAMLDGKGRLCFEKADLIVYNHGQYMPVQKKVIGGFGFSVMKEKTKKKHAAARRSISRMKKK